MAATHRITVNLAATEYEDLAALAEENQVSMAWLSRRAIKELLTKHKGQVDQSQPVLLRSQED